MEQRDAEHRAFFRPVILPGAQVLADEGGHGQREAGDGQKAEALDLGVSPAAGHRHFPNLLMLDWTTTLAKAMIEFWKPAGRPLTVIWRSMSGSKRIMRGTIRYSAWVRKSRDRHSRALMNWDRMVAKGRGAHSQAESGDEQEV